MDNKQSDKWALVEFYLSSDLSPTQTTYPCTVAILLALVPVQYFCVRVYSIFLTK